MYKYYTAAHTLELIHYGFAVIAVDLLVTYKYTYVS